MVSLSPVLLLATGTIINIIGQYVTDTNFADPKSQIIPWIKFTSSLLFAFIAKTLTTPPKTTTNSQQKKTFTATAHNTAKQQKLMTIIGILDLAAYTTFILGFNYCGNALSNILLASSGQIFTAIATRFILKKRLSSGQLAAIACVCVGLAVRVAPQSYFDIPLLQNLLPTIPTSSGSTTHASSTTMTKVGAATLTKTTTTQKQQPNLGKGAALIIIAAFLYSGLGVTYELLVTTTGTPPPYGDVLWHISKLGFIVSTAYQLVYTLPRWSTLVAGRAAAHAVSTPYVVGLLVCFSFMYNAHVFAQSLVFKTEGAICVGLVNAVRGAVMTVLSGVMFCSGERPWLCMTPQSVVTAAITTVGGIAWVLSKPAASSKEAATGEKGNSTSEVAVEETESKKEL